MPTVEIEKVSDFKKGNKKSPELYAPALLGERVSWQPAWSWQQCAAEVGKVIKAREGLVPAWAVERPGKE